MSIILNEREWAMEAINSHQLGKKPIETLGRVARYYHQVEKYRKKELISKLEAFMLQCDPEVILVKWADAIERAAMMSDRLPLIELDGVNVTYKELQAVQSLDGVQLQRLAFTLLCAAKYWNAVNEKNNDWANIDDKDLMSMANINTSANRQSAMLRKLRDAGLIRFSKKVNSLNVQVSFIDNDHKSAIYITDFRNLGNQYMIYIGEPYIQCSLCGLAIRSRGHGHKYCPDCATEMYVRKSAESATRQITGQVGENVA